MKEGLAAVVVFDAEECDDGRTPRVRLLLCCHLGELSVDCQEGLVEDTGDLGIGVAVERFEEILWDSVSA